MVNLFLNIKLCLEGRRTGDVRACAWCELSARGLAELWKACFLEGRLAGGGARACFAVFLQ